MRYEGINYWAFILNPGTFKVEDVVDKAIRGQEEVYWLVRNREVRKGDRAIIWKTKGNKTKNIKQRSGIIALAEVLEDPKLMNDPDRDGWVKQNKADKDANRVRIRYLVSPNLPLWEGETNLKVLEEKKLIVQKPNIQGPAFHIQLEWEDIIEAIGGWPDKPPELENAELALAELVGKNQPG
ncbi:MAG TPA: EVE domain-containing protein, partial [Ktedonobacteraceae bacterium]|nr:EVE domain-containing protein [Ktedonobacteraceae bacterium]